MYNTSSDNESMDVASDDISESSANDVNYLVPERSRKAYERTYTDFMNWKITNKEQSFDEAVLLAYFQEMSDKFKYSSISTNFSILKNTLMLKHKVDISKYSTVIALIKSKAEGYSGKKSKTFSPGDINKFLKEANDDDYLAAKVALIFGIVGACRRQELHRLQFNDVEVCRSRILVNIYNTKSKTSRVFTITGDYYDLVKKYISLRPHHCHSTSFFIHHQAGKYTSKGVGINQFGNIGKIIAKYLNLPNPELYTGHCFRRTSATILVDADGDILPLKGHARYKTIPEPENCINHLVATSTAKNCTQNRNEPSITAPETWSNNLTEGNTRDGNEFPSCFKNENIEHVNIVIPNIATEVSDNSMESKEEVWSQINETFFKMTNQNKKSSDTSVSEDCYDDTIEDEDNERKPIPNPLGDNNKVVNINMPGTSSNLQRTLSTLVRFNNCTIQNVNIYCNK